MKESKHKKYSTKEIKSNLKIQFEIKTVKTIMGVLVLSLILTTVSCKGGAKAESSTQTEQQEMDEYTSAYVCPMHCEGSGSATEGSCPKCGMTYVKNEDHNANGHKH